MRLWSKIFESGKESENTREGVSMYDPNEEEGVIDLLSLWRAIFKRKWVLAACIGSALLFAGIYSFKATPRYKATTTMLIEEEGSRILNIEDEFGYRQSVPNLFFFNTQLKLLESKSLAERTARKMDLLNNPLFARKTKSNNTETDGPDPNPYFGITKTLQSNLDISPFRQTRMVEVSYTCPDPELASRIINTLAEEFIDFSVEKRLETTEQASKFLTDQIANLRETLAAKEKELHAYSEGKDLFFLSDKESAAINKFSDLNEALTQAQISRIQSEAAYRELKSLKVDSLPQFINNTLIQDLKTEYTQLKNNYEEMLKVYKPDYPSMVQAKGKLDSMQTQLESEIAKAIDAAESEYRTALKRETSLNQLLDEQKTNVTQMQSNAILYNSLQIEVDNMRKLLNSLVERQKEILVSSQLGSLKTGNMSIIDRSEPPRRPVSPRKALNLILAFIIGSIGGVGLCLVLEYLDNTVKGPEDVQRLVELPSLGIIPFLSPAGMKKMRKHGYYRYHYSSEQESAIKPGELAKLDSIELINHLHPKFSISEDYRTVRTSILLSYPEKSPKTIAFTSALPREGKTATVANMAVAFSQLGLNVLVVDSDMRKPRLHRIFEINSTRGLTGYLTGKIPLKECVFKTAIDHIWLIPAGPIPPNPSELIDSRPMKDMIETLKKGFDIILLDTPPLLAVVDPVIIGSIVDATVLVLQSGKTTEKALLGAAEELGRGKVKTMGVVFNGVRLDKEDYSYSKYYRSYYRSRGYGVEESNKTKSAGGIEA